jgi:hypothetical protein
MFSLVRLSSVDMDDLANGRGGTWTLLTGHGHVLVEIARNPRARTRDISFVVGLTERTVQAIVADLEAAGYLTRTRVGRRNLYTVNSDSLFRHRAQEGLRVGPFLALLAAADSAGTPQQTGVPGIRPAGSPGERQDQADLP